MVVLGKEGRKGAKGNGLLGLWVPRICGEQLEDLKTHEHLCHPTQRGPRHLPRAEAVGRRPSLMGEREKGRHNLLNLSAASGDPQILTVTPGDHA